MKVNPFHSSLKETDVHHNNNACTEGNNLKWSNRVEGAGHLPLCPRCKELNDEGK